MNIEFKRHRPLTSESGVVLWYRVALVLGGGVLD